jgi:hypothetical protein
LAIAMSDPDTRGQILAVFFDSQTEPGKPFVDAADLCLNLLGLRQYPVLSQRARDLGDYLVAHHGNVVGRSKVAEGWPLVAEHGRNSGSLVRLNGLSLYAPHVAPPAEPEMVRRLYDELSFAKATEWGGLVHKLALYLEAV